MRDTTYVSTHDTIPMPYPVEVIKEVEKELNWRERIQMGVGKFAMWLLLAAFYVCHIYSFYLARKSSPKVYKNPQTRKSGD